MLPYNMYLSSYLYSYFFMPSHFVNLFERVKRAMGYNGYIFPKKNYSLITYLTSYNCCNRDSGIRDIKYGSKYQLPGI